MVRRLQTSLCAHGVLIMSSSRVDKHTEKFVTKEVHGQLVRVRILKPHLEEDEPPPSTMKKKVRVKYCEWCEVEVFDAGKTCDLCNREF